MNYMCYSKGNVYKIRHSKVRLNLYTESAFALVKFFFFFLVLMTNEKVGEAVVEVVGLKEP